MAVGPGKYDDLCTRARIAAEARGAILLIIEGRKGSGFSCQASLEVTARLPDILRSMADDMEADVKRDIREAQSEN